MTNELATTENKRSLIADMAAEQGLEPNKFYAAIQTLCGCREAKPEHFSGLLMVARELRLNPILKQIALVNNKGSVSITIPIDGYVAIMTRHPDYVTHKVEVFWKGKPYDGHPLAAKITIWRKSQMEAGLPPFEHEELFSEVYLPPKAKRDGGTFEGPWQSHPVRMLRWKVINQGVRECFGVSIPDRDEIESRNRYDDEPRTVPAEVVPRVPLDALPAGDVGDESPEVGDADADDGGLARSATPAVEYDEEQSRALDAEIARQEEIGFDD